jgi:hypothetical protein
MFALSTRYLIAYACVLLISLCVIFIFHVNKGHHITVANILNIQIFDRLIN